MLFVASKHLKPGMILAKDIVFHNNSSFNNLLLTKGQVLNRTYIKGIQFHNIDGAYVECESFDDIVVESYINHKLKASALAQVKEIYYEFKVNSGKTRTSSMKQLSNIVNDLVKELLNKNDLTYNVIDFKNYDTYTFQHCLNVAILSISTGIALGMKEYDLHKLGMAGLLHDIGKMLTPVEILNKPGKLTNEEFNIIKLHPINAHKQLNNQVSFEILRAIESHHEKLDGTGYPYGRKDDNISYFAKILAVCDVYDALTSDRPYRKAAFPNEVVEYIMGCTDTHFEYEIVKHFIKVIVAYPIGTFVKLSSGKAAVVVKNYSENTLRPLVRIVNEDGSVGEDVDLLYNNEYMNVTIIGMDYDFDISKLSGVFSTNLDQKASS
jgi:putative nucleotidyltransferase with HDIG domain